MMHLAKHKVRLVGQTKHDLNEVKLYISRFCCTSCVPSLKGGRRGGKISR